MDQQPQIPPPPSGQPPVPTAPPHGRFRTGLRLMGISWGVVKSEPSLLVLPILSMIAGLFLLLAFAGVFWSTGIAGRMGDAFSSTSSSNDASAAVAGALNPLDYALTGLYYFLASFVVVFFNAAIIAVARKRLNGEDATVGDGLRMASKHAGKIAVWALITATVGMILRAIQDRVGFLGDIIIGLIGVAWALITFFVVPVLLFEDLGAVASVKRSASIFKQKWGEQITGTIGITAILGIIGFLGVLAGVALVFVQPILGAIAIVLVIIAISALSGAITGVFNTALYLYATTGQAGTAFTEADMASAFYSKKKRR